jgi:Ca2+-binding RTX toxin-like protein
VRINLSSADQVVNGVTLVANTGLDGFGTTDSFVNINSAWGSNYDDILVGNGNWSRLGGGAGNDTLVGTSAGSSNSNEIVNFAVFDDDGTQGALVNLSSSSQTMGGRTVASNTAIDQYGNTDTLININGVAGSDRADSIIGSAGNDRFTGNDGADTINGGQGSDWIMYEDQDPGSVKVNLGADNYNMGGTTVTCGTGRDGWGNVDTLVSIENARGSRYDDFLRAATGGSMLEGQGGSDTLIGNSGADEFRWTNYNINNTDHDVVQNFTQGQDHIALYGVGMDWGTLQSHMTVSGGSTTLDLTSSGFGRITVQGVTSLQSDDFWGLG